ncbi:MAG: hypothetical protein JSW04_06120 [Desulfobacterales bacterium]|nr:MAG: hypothetical protein JSW04_06120 [Desulfobacterales bacterium]
MKKHKRIYTISIILFFIIASGVSAEEKMKAMDHAAHVGEKIHESIVHNYRFAYHLINLPNQDEHHLMTHVLDPEHSPVKEAKVGYLIIGPNNAKQKVMTMAMKGSFGGNVNFVEKGTYTVKIKALVDDKKLMDEFIFQVK